MNKKMMELADKLNEITENLMEVQEELERIATDTDACTVVGATTTMGMVRAASKKYRAEILAWIHSDTDSSVYEFKTKEDYSAMQAQSWVSSYVSRNKLAVRTALGGDTLVLIKGARK